MGRGIEEFVRIPGLSDMLVTFTYLDDEIRKKKYLTIEEWVKAIDITICLPYEELEDEEEET